MFVATLYGLTEAEKNQLFTRIRRKIGAPLVAVELTDEQLEECFCESIEEYVSIIHRWVLENRLGEMLGLPSEVDFTLKFVSDSLYFEKALTKSIAEQAGLGMNGVREMKAEAITLTAGVQNYEIPAGREVSQVMWYTPSFLNLYGLFPFDHTAISFTEFGASYAGYSLYHVMPVFDTILTAQAAQLRNRVRGAEYSYMIRPGKNGKKILTLFPPPRPINNPSEPGFNGIYTTAGTLIYFYRERTGYYGNPELVGTTANPDLPPNFSGQGNNLVSSFADAKMEMISYTQLNHVAKNWIRKYTQVLAKEILAIYVRGKFDGKIPFEENELSLNVSNIIEQARAEKEDLKKEVETYLQEWSYEKIMERRSNIQKHISDTYQNLTFGIYLF